MRVFEFLKDRIQGKAPKGAKRSPLWREVRKEFLKDNPTCAVCGSTKKIQVHHVIPFHVAPDLELEPGNLLTLCESGRYGLKSCHLAIGHLGNYRRTNLNVREDSRLWKGRFRGD